MSKSKANLNTKQRQDNMFAINPFGQKTRNYMVSQKSAMSGDYNKMPRQRKSEQDAIKRHMAKYGTVK